MRTLGDKIRKCRKAKGLSQKKLAELLNIQYQSVQDWERDRTKPATGKIQKLCEIFNITSTWLFSIGESEYPDKGEMSVGESPATYAIKSESKRYLKIFERLRPETQEIVIKLMEALLLRDTIENTGKDKDHP
ncbi:MAG: helix-turn-helix domain-containing protein [Thermodesulfobacteriota bacterium]